MVPEPPLPTCHWATFPSSMLCMSKSVCVQQDSALPRLARTCSCALRRVACVFVNACAHFVLRARER